MQDYRLTELSSGVRVVSETLDTVRSVALGFWIGAGSRDEVDGEAGISHFLEHLLFKGTARHTATEIAEIFDALGAESNAFTSKESTCVHARCLDRHAEQAFELAAEMVFGPTYRELETEREVILEEIAMYEDEPQDKVHDILQEAVFGGHPLGRPVIGTEAAVRSLGLDEVSAYHDRRYVPGNIVIAAAGYIEHAALVETVSAKLGGLSARAVPPHPEPPGRAGPKALFRGKDTDQYHLALGGPGIARNDDRRFALTILDSILGGAVSSRLFQEIREKRGLAYSVYSFTGQYHDSGYAGVYVGTRPENVVEAVRVIAAELDRLQDDPASEEEIERAKENFKGRFVLSMESTSTRMNRLGTSVLGDIDILSLDEIIARIDAVDVGALRDLARELFRPDGMSAAGIGADEGRFREALAAVSGDLAAVA